MVVRRARTDGRELYPTRAPRHLRVDGRGTDLALTADDLDASCGLQGGSRAFCRKCASRDDRLHRLAGHFRHRFPCLLSDLFELVRLLGRETHGYHKANGTSHLDLRDLVAELDVARLDSLIP